IVDEDVEAARLITAIDDEWLSLPGTAETEVGRGSANFVSRDLPVAVEIPRRASRYVRLVDQADHNCRFVAEHVAVEVAVAATLAFHADAGFPIAATHVPIDVRITVIAWPDGNADIGAAVKSGAF